MDVCSDEVLNELQNSSTTEQDKIVLNDILVQLLKDIIYVIKTQLHDYLEGTSAHLSPSVVHQASSAPVHNMFAEHTLGMADYLYRKPSNIKVGFLDGIVKCNIRNNAVVVCTLSRKYCSILHQTSSESKVSKQHEYN